MLTFGGWIYSAYVLILISNVIMASENSENKFEEMKREIDAFCDAKNLSEKLTKKIKTFYKLKFQKHYFNEDAIKDSTPACLRKEIMMHSCAYLVSKVPLFKEIPQLLIEKFVSCLKMEIFFPDDVIIEAGTPGDAMFFIAHGTAAIYSTTGNHLTTISDGAHFGEISLLLRGHKRVATVITLEISEVYKLNRKDFRRFIEPHAELLQKLEQMAFERIKHLKQQEKVFKKAQVVNILSE
jgi:hyperpolarization activated cyclic nucleotide-gated potassium channel 2